MTKKCLILCYSHLGKDPRVMKHYRALKDAGFEIITAGVEAIGDEKKFIRIAQFNFTEWLNDYSKTTKLKRVFLSLFVRVLNFYKYKLFKNFYVLRYWNLRRVFDLLKLRSAKNVDLIIANDIETLPLAMVLASLKTKVLYDAHEFHEEQYADNKFWVNYMRPLVIYFNRKYIPKVDVCITVGKNIAMEFSAIYNTKFEVILNAPPYEDLKPSVLSDSEKIKLVHPGNYVSNRNIDELVYMMNYLPDHYELHFLLVADDNTLNKLKKKAGNLKNIVFHKPVGVYEVSRYINQFDIGVALIPATTFNYDNALPNKFFQFIQARLVTAFGPLAEISNFTALHQTGIVSEGYTGLDLANAVKKLSVTEINSIKNRNNANSAEFCEEREIVKLKQVYSKMMN